MKNTKHPIFSPVELWHKQLINRTVVAPMSRVSALSDGSVTGDMINYYTAFAKGGFSVIITEGIYTDNVRSKSYQNQPGIVTREHVMAWSELTRSVHEHPALIFAQLMHGGALSQFFDNTLAPSAVKPIGEKMMAYGGSGTFALPAAMTAADIETVKQGFIMAAHNAYLAGFDGVEIHAANGYLLDQFLTAELNERDDDYGGDIEKRFRIISEIIEGIRKLVPQSFIVGLRLSEGKVNDLQYRWKDGIISAISLFTEVKKAGLDFIHAAVQTGEWERDSFYSDGSSFASLGRKLTGLPVIANGGLHQLDKSKLALEELHADLIAIGKAAISDPHWPLKTINGSPTVSFHRDMLWPEATIQHSRNIIEQQNKI